MAGAVNSQAYKEALGKLPTGISIITTHYKDQLFGFTASSLTSLSLSPPLILFCLSKNAGSFEAFKRNDKFAISILAENQADISKHFASVKFEKFANISYQIGAYSNSPLIRGAICWIECDQIQEYEGGDHIIFIGEVKETKINNQLNPLLYFSKNYRKFEQT